MQSVMHAQNSADKFGGNMEDYLDIHEFLDSSKASINDNRHRALTHNSWFIRNVIPRVFGAVRKNSKGKSYSTVDIAEQHIMEDYNMLFVPTPQDFLQEIPLRDWMDNARNNDVPPSRKALKEKTQKRPATRPTKISFPKEFSRPTRGCGGGHGVID